MNDNVTTYNKFVLKRMADPIDIFGWSVPAEAWWGILAVVLLVGAFYIGWMYFRDSRGVGPWWATLLGTLRFSVYLILAGVFLLPGCQSGEQRQLSSKVAVLFDTSLSVQNTKDDVPKNIEEWKKLPTRQDLILQFLAKDNSAFLKELQHNNPITVYRFGSRLDEAYLQLADNRYFFRDEWEKLLQEKKQPTGPQSGMPGEFWASYLKPDEEAKPAASWDKATKERFDKLVKLNAEIGKTGIFRGTNLYSSVLSAHDHELNNLVQGIVVFSDGHSTTESLEALEQLRQQAKTAKIPIFVVGVGKARRVVKIEIQGLLVPPTVRPDDKFRAVVEITGEGLPGKNLDVFLDIEHILTKRTKDDPKGKEEALDIVLIERIDKPEGKVDTEKLDRITLPLKKLTLKPVKPAQLTHDSTPRCEVEFEIDAAILAEAAGVDLVNDPKYSGKKWELDVTRSDPSGLNTSALRFTVRTPRDANEIFAEEEHVSRPGNVEVHKKELSVLIFASGPERDYQFLRTLLAREVQKGRAKTSIYLQPVPPLKEPRAGVQQDIDAKRMLKRFPDRFDQGATEEEERIYDLAEYDVIVCFDPDWTELSPEQISMLERWVDRGGGLVVVGGPIHTLELARPGAENTKLKAIVQMYPVVLDDIRIREVDRKTDTPWPLKFDQISSEMEFLRLKEDVDTGTTTLESDWEDFYGTSEEERSGVKRGFFRYYPVKNARQGSRVVARFSDPESKIQNGEQMPYLVLSDPASGRRVAWLGSGEMWRLRMYSEAFHERFWTKLLRFVAAGGQGRARKRIQIYLSQVFKVNDFVRVEARIDGKGGEPLPTTSRPELIVKAPRGSEAGDKPMTFPMTPKKGSEGVFMRSFQVHASGKYDLELNVKETGEKESRSFDVEDSDPELDNTKPNEDALYALASEADMVLSRIQTTNDRRAVEQALSTYQPTAVPTSAPDEATPDKKVRPRGSKPRLYFNLENAHLIPKCMIKEQPVKDVPGKVTDLWDRSWKPFGYDTGISEVLLAVVLLLSAEWLIRKLLRLA
jgi:hypothetical protein